MTIEPVRIEHELPAPVYEVIPAEFVGDLGKAIHDLEKLPVNICAESAGDANACAIHLASALKKIEAHRKIIKKPVLDLGKAIDACAKNAVADADALLRDLKNRIAAHQRQESQRIANHHKNIMAISDWPSKAMQLREPEEILACGKQLTEWAQIIDWQEFGDEANEVAMRAQENIKRIAEEAQQRIEAEAQAQAEKEKAEKLAAMLGDDEAEREAQAQKKAQAQHEAEMRRKLIAEQRAAETRACEKMMAQRAAQAAKVSAVNTRSVRRVVIRDETKIPVEMAGAILRPVDHKAVEKLVKAGVKIPGCELVTEEHAVMAGSKE